MNICDMYNKMYRVIDYIMGVPGDDVTETNIINVITGIIIFIIVMIVYSWWLIPSRLLKENYKFKSSKYVLIYKKMYCRTIKISELSKWESEGWEPKAIFRR